MGKKNDSVSVCLLGASLTTHNMGVGALTAGAVKCIRRRFPEAEIFLLDYGKRELTHNLTINGKNVLLRLINLRFSKKIYLKNNVLLLILLASLIRLVPLRALREALISKNRYLSAIAGADITAAISGGDSFSDIYGLERFFYVVLPQILVLMSGQGLVLLPQTLGPFNKGVSRAIAGRIMRKALMIYSRDHDGLERSVELFGSGIRDKIRFGYDVGFVLEAQRPQKDGFEAFFAEAPEACLTVGLNVSGLLYSGGYTGDNMFGLKSDYRELVDGLLELLIMELRCRVALIPHVFGGPGHIESDSAACADVYGRLKPRYGENLFFSDGEYDQSEIKYVIGRCGFFIGSRMHACIAAISQCVPSAAVAYSEKFLGVMRSIGLGNIVADPRTMEKDEIIGRVRGLIRKKDEIRLSLEEEMPRVKKQALDLFMELADG